METVARSFNYYAAKEISYRGKHFDIENVLDDITSTGLLIARREKNKEPQHLQNFKEIQAGLLQFRNYQMSTPFRIDEAIVPSAKAALLATKIKALSYEPLPVFQPTMQKKDFLIQDLAYQFLNKLPPEPLFYWFHTLQII